MTDRHSSLCLFGRLHVYCCLHRLLFGNKTCPCIELHGCCTVFKQPILEESTNCMVTVGLQCSCVAQNKNCVRMCSERGVSKQDFNKQTLKKQKHKKQKPNDTIVQRPSRYGLRNFVFFCWGVVGVFGSFVWCLWFSFFEPASRPNWRGDRPHSQAHPKPRAFQS